MDIADQPSPNNDPRPEGQVVDMLVLHYTGMIDAGSAIERLCDPAAEVSAHYVIDENGAVLQLVAEESRAWHAGIASWRGIELVNPGHEFGYRRFPAQQMEALAELAAAVLVRHPIPARNVVGHSDVAPRRKQDPGELFDWRWLAARGIGLWPEDGASTVAADGDDTAALLAACGYETEDLAATIAAFQRHFRPDRIDGVADAGTVARLAALARLT